MMKPLTRRPRAKESVKLKLMKGNPGKRKLPAEPEPPPGKPDAPEYLDEYAREEWDRIVDGLAVMGVVAPIDQSTLAAYCSAYSMWRGAQEALDLKIVQQGSKGYLSFGARGTSINPLVKIIRQAGNDMLKYSIEFGLTPAARARLAIKPEEKPRSKFDGLIGQEKRKG